MISELREKSDQRTSHKIDDQGSQRELDAGGQLLSKAAHEVTED